MYNKLFISALKFIQKINGVGRPQENACYILSVLEISNFGSILLMLRFFIDFNLKSINKLLFIGVLAPLPFIINYFVFLHKKRYYKIITSNKELGISIFITYFILSLLFWIIAGYLNIIKYGE